MASGLKDVGFTISSKLIILISSIGTQSILAWILGPGPRGSYAVCILFSIFLSLVFVVGCDLAGIYFISSKKISLSETVIIITMLGGITSFIAILAGLLIMQFPFSFLENATTQEFYLALALIPVTIFSNAYTRIFTALQAFGLFAVLSVATGFVNFLFTVILLYFLSMSVEGALYANIISGSAAIIAAIAVLVFKFNLKFVKTSIKDFIDILFFDLRHYVGKVSNEVNFRIGEMLLALFATKEQIGFFSIAVSITSRVNLIPDALDPVLMPRIASDKTGRDKLVARSARITFILSSSVLLILVIFTEDIISILFSSEFLPSVLLIRILAIGMLVRSTSKVFIPYIIGTNHPGIVSIIIIIGIPINLVLLLILLPEIGLPGAAIAMALGYLTTSILLMISFAKLTGQSFRELWSYKSEDLQFMLDALKRILKK